MVIGYLLHSLVNRGELIHMNYNEQIRMFKKKISVGVKKTSELINIFKAKADIKEILLNDIPGYTKNSIIYNVKHSMLNEYLQLNPNEMIFFAFLMIKNQKSEKYFCDKYQFEKFIYVVFEEHTGYVWSNNNRLFVELELERGVSQQEFYTEGILFRSLLSHIAILYCDDNNIPMTVTSPEQAFYKD